MAYKAKHKAAVGMLLATHIVCSLLLHSLLRGIVGPASPVTYTYRMHSRAKVV